MWTGRAAAGPDVAGSRDACRAPSARRITVRPTQAVSLGYGIAALQAGGSGIGLGARPGRGSRGCAVAALQSAGTAFMGTFTEQRRFVLAFTRADGLVRGITALRAAWGGLMWRVRPGGWLGLSEPRRFGSVGTGLVRTAPQPAGPGCGIAAFWAEGNERSGP